MSEFYLQDPETGWFLGELGKAGGNVVSTWHEHPVDAICHDTIEQCLMTMIDQRLFACLNVTEVRPFLFGGEARKVCAVIQRPINE